MADRNDIQGDAPSRDETYEPSTVQVDRARMQGLGVGQKDLDYQRDPTGARSAEQRSYEPEDGVEAADANPDDRIQAGPPGKPDEAYDARDGDEVSFSQPSGGAGA